MKWELAGTSEFCAFASTMPKCASVEGSGLLEIVQVAPSVPSWASVFVYTVLTFAVPLKPPATTTNALVFDDCTATARSPARGLGSGVVVVQVTLLALKLLACTRFKVTPLLVPPDVLTVTVTVPGTVKLVGPLPLGTTATMLVFDHPPAAGVTVAEMLPCVKITCPGAA